MHHTAAQLPIDGKYIPADPSVNDFFRGTPKWEASMAQRPKLLESAGAALAEARSLPKPRIPSDGSPLSDSVWNER